ncbi:MAG: hypothetical protein KME35_13910 [Aphanocapsa sp. GSE-SYN-MK-11-07L]|jgi:hypothetical protein|nr:hypothetical protein [Aphanocapsa sp. GSE-SYN-MK-11-07L]
MIFLLHSLAQLLAPALVPICCVMAWGLTIMMLSSLWSLGKDVVKQVKRLHTIPCANCVFLTGDYHLKCTVNPCGALTEAAIDCPDYRPVS